MIMKIDTDTDDGKAELQKLIDAETKGLKAKNDELLGEVKKQKDSLKSIQDQLDEIKEAKEAAELEAAKKTGDVDKLVAAAEAKKNKEIDGLKNQLEQQTSRLNQTLIDKGLSDALVKANVAPHHLPTVTAFLKSTAKAEIIDKDGNAVATFDGRPIEEFVTGWAQGDTGKHYIAAPQNGGGGASGSNGGGKATGDINLSPVARLTAAREKQQQSNRRT
jgi:hypothetical protein